MGAGGQRKRRHAARPSSIADKFDVSDAEDVDREPISIPNSMDVDPADPVQGIGEVDELQVEDLGVDAISVAEATSSREDSTLERSERAAPEGRDRAGAPTPPARALDHRAARGGFDEGQTWLEALETSAVERGVEPERELFELVDDEDLEGAPRAGDRRDPPVADRGSGGPAGI